MAEYLLESFQKELSQIKEYIKHIHEVNKLGSVEALDDDVFKSFKKHFISFDTDKKLFEYKAIIISLYGLLEKYIEIWVKEYLSELSELISYSNLPENIRNSHFELSMKLITMVVEGRWVKYNHLNKEEVLKKLSNCLEKPSMYSFNTEAFTMQSGNLTHKRIEEIFKTLDIQISKKLIKNTQLNLLIGISDDRITHTEGNILYAKINDLVERRNDIAHGVEIIDNLLGLSEIEPYIEFFEKYCMAIFSILEEKNIENSTFEKYQEINQKCVLLNKSIIVFAMENYEIRIKDWIIIETSANRFYKKQIQSLGKDNRNDYTELQIAQQTDIAIKIDNGEQLPINGNCKFYIKK